MALLEQVRRTRKPIRITRFGKPIADIIPAGTRVRDRHSWIGSMKDSIEILGDIISPTTDEDEWEALRDDARAAGPG
jgi:antitoxin (DNA-binding transcriptional repressor) of toxin-antitoxin stability system